MFYKSCISKNIHENDRFKVEFERMKMLKEDRKRNSKIRLKDLCNRATSKGMITAIAMAWFMQTTGAVLIMNYASLIFSISGSALSTNVSGIILAVVQILGGLVSTQLGDTFGRKTTLFISLSGSAFGLFTFMIYSYLQQNDYDVSNYLWPLMVCRSLFSLQVLAS